MTSNVDRLVILDIDGVIYCDGGAAPSSPEAIELIREMGIKIRYLTNDSIAPRRARAAELASLGFNITASDIFSASSLAARYLSRLGAPRALLLIDQGCLEEFTDVNIDSNDPEVVVVGDIFGSFAYEELNTAFRAIHDGARFLATQRNRFSSTSGAPNIDVGFFVSGLEYCTGKEAEIVGKPSRRSYLEVCQEANVSPDNAIMVSDDLDSDLLGAHNAGLATAYITDYSVPGSGELFATPTYTARNLWDLAVSLRDSLGRSP